MSDRTVLHVKGRVLVGPEEVRDELWVVDGRISYDRPAGARDIRTVRGWALPGLVDAHCHVGLDRHGAVPRDVAEKQALTDRDAGHAADPRRGLAVRHPLDRRPRRPAEDHPRRAARSPPHPPLHPQLRLRRSSRHDLVAYVAQEAARAARPSG
ncbi:Imidazolonepropionase-like amidohydrolase OS=Streptomyces violarus OX=67380 GN=FHS41_008129 PE=4 SV=1 [Streptomyces violarus]